MPTIVLAVSLLICACTAFLPVYEKNIIRQIDVFDDDKIIGVQYVLTGDDNCLVAVGQFITDYGNECNAQFYNMKFQKGNISNDEGCMFCGQISKSMDMYRIEYEDFIGKSLVYEQLERLKDKSADNILSYKVSVIRIIICIFPSVVLLVLLAISDWVRKKHNMLKKQCSKIYSRRKNMATISEMGLGMLIVIILLLSEVFLSIRKHFAWGLMPISLIAVLICFCWVHSLHEVNAYYNKVDTYILNNGYSAEMTLKFNSEKEVVA